jgi:hypothetical protein
LLLACESAANASGFVRVELTSTLAGIPFYERHGYGRAEPLNLPLGKGIVLPVVRMEKSL